jgi:molybdopterin converting factor small subunit
MPFEKGQVSGRPVGAENKNRATLREAISKATEGQLPDFLQTLEELREEQPAKFLEIYLRLLEYSIPKLRSIDTNVELGSDTISKIVVEVKK